MPPRRDREGNEADVLVFRPRSAQEALRVRDLLAGAGVSLEMPEAAVEVMFAEGKDSIEVRVPLEQADAAAGVLEAEFGADRMPANEDGRSVGGDLQSELAAIEARARELEEEDERQRLEREARRAQRAAAPEAEEDEGAVEKVVYGLLAVVLVVILSWVFTRMQ